MNRFFSLVILLTAFFAQPALAASFGDEVKAEHPCLAETSLPWRISPMKADSVPATYAGWSGLYAGAWTGASKPLCHVLVIQSIGADGKAKVLYSTGKPYYEHGTFDAVISEKDDGVQVLELVLGNGTKASYIKAAEGKLQGRYGDYAMGTLKAVKY